MCVMRTAVEKVFQRHMTFADTSEVFTKSPSLGLPTNSTSVLREAAGSWVKYGLALIISGNMR